MTHQITDCRLKMKDYGPLSLRAIRHSRSIDMLTESQHNPCVLNLNLQSSRLLSRIFNPQSLMVNP